MLILQIPLQTLHSISTFKRHWREKSKHFLFSRITKEIDSLSKVCVRQCNMHYLSFWSTFLMESKCLSVLYVNMSTHTKTHTSTLVLNAAITWYSRDSSTPKSLPAEDRPHASYDPFLVFFLLIKANSLLLAVRLWEGWDPWCINI